MTEYKELSHWADEDLQYEICEKLSYMRSNDFIQEACHIITLLDEFERRQEDKYKPNGN